MDKGVPEARQGAKNVEVRISNMLGCIFTVVKISTYFSDYTAEASDIMSLNQTED